MNPDPARLIFGTNPITTLPTRGHAFRLLEAAVEAGVTHFDTARAYGQGYGERLVGEFLRAHGGRVLLTAKVGLGEASTGSLPTRAVLPMNDWRRRMMGGGRPPYREGRPAVKLPEPLDLDRIRHLLDETFKCLQVDQVETLLLHEHLPSGLDDRGRAFFDTLIQDGRVSELGTGTSAFVLDAFYEPVKGFTVLQYEGGGKDSLPDLITRFPDHRHYRHGFLRDLDGADPARALATAQQESPTGKVIFSTRSVSRIRENVGREHPRPS